MKKTDVATVAKLIIATRKHGHHFFLPFEIEEKFRINKSIIMNSLNILRDMEAFDYTEVPWNPEEDKWDKIAQMGGLRKPRSELEEKYHINEIGVVFMHHDIIDAFNNGTRIPQTAGRPMDVALLERIATNPEMIPNKLVKKYSELIEQPDDEIKPIIKHNVPWEEIAIKFKDKFEVEIFIGGTLDRSYRYADLYFAKRGVSDDPPNQQWEFLRILSIIQKFDPTRATAAEMTRLLSEKNPRLTLAACVKTKSILAHHLQKLFGKPKEDDPFWKYEKNNNYSTRFILEPEPDLRGDGEPEPTRAVTIDAEGRPYQERSTIKKGYRNEESETEDSYEEDLEN